MMRQAKRVPKDRGKTKMSGTSPEARKYSKKFKKLFGFQKVAQLSRCWIPGIVPTIGPGSVVFLLSFPVLS
jgi:hypothetical protein